MTIKNRVIRAARDVAVSVAMVLSATACAAGAPAVTGASDPRPETSTIAESRDVPESTTRTTAPPPAIGLGERCGDPMVPRSRPFVIPSGGGHLSGVSARTGKRGIVLIHGSGSRGICVWLKELPWLAAAGYHVLAYDQGCVGGSSCPQPTDPLLEARIVTANLKRLGAERVTVVVASAGGPYALHLAADPDSGITAAVPLSPPGLDNISRASTRPPMRQPPGCRFRY